VAIFREVIDFQANSINKVHIIGSESDIRTVTGRGSLWLRLFLWCLRWTCTQTNTNQKRIR